MLLQLLFLLHFLKLLHQQVLFKLLQVLHFYVTTATTVTMVTTAIIVGSVNTGVYGLM